LFSHQGKSGEDKICLVVTQLANGVELINVPCITILLLTLTFWDILCLPGVLCLLIHSICWKSGLAV